MYTPHWHLKGCVIWRHPSEQTVTQANFSNGGTRPSPRKTFSHLWLIRYTGKV